MTNNQKGQQHLLEKHLRFHEELLNVQFKSMQHLVAVISFKKLNKIDVDAKIKNGDYIISPQDVIVEEKELEDIFDKILPVMRKYYNDQDELKRLEDLNDKRKFSLRALVENVLARKDENWENLAQQFKISKDLLKKIGEYISSPYLELCSEYFNKKIQTKKWEKPICPICGSHPSMALINEKLSYRSLWCHLCDTIWKFKENICPFCLNGDLKSLKHIFPPEKSHYRIDACDQCNTYLKTVDEQLISKKQNFIVEYLSTHPLDKLAEQKGYHKCKNYLSLRS